MGGMVEGDGIAGTSVYVTGALVIRGIVGGVELGDVVAPPVTGASVETTGAVLEGIKSTGGIVRGAELPLTGARLAVTGY